jgi:hypothetical protein
VTDDALPDHLSSEFIAEISRHDANKVYYVAMRGLPVTGRVVREKTSGRSSVVIQSNRQTGSGPACRVYRHDEVTGQYQKVSEINSRPDQ